uniref:C2H2-type domain-containing protein n=1 Tax=Anopheles farauti TaxID=69004 RepID=A0A182Q038_9DIPT
MDQNTFPLWQVSATDTAVRDSGTSSVNNAASISALHYVPSVREKMKFINISSQMPRTNDSGSLYGTTTTTYLPVVNERRQQPLIQQQPRRVTALPPNATTTSMLNESILLQTHDGREYLVDESSIQNIDQTPPENLIYMTTTSTSTTPAVDEGVLSNHLAMDGDGGNYLMQNGGQTMDHQREEEEPEPDLQPAATTYAEECEVTEEIITDDWVQSQDEECVQVTVDQLGASAIVVEDDIAVPLDQDQYTLSRPYPCDFCSRRFRKKATLQNHLMAHSNDRPHVCKLCGAQYGRRCDLINHFRQHAYAVAEQDELALRGGGGEQDVDYDLSELMPRPDLPQQPKNRATRHSSDDEDMYVQNAMVDYNSQPPMQLISTTSYGGSISSSFANEYPFLQQTDSAGDMLIQQPLPPPSAPPPTLPLLGRKKAARRATAYIKNEPLDTAEPMVSEIRPLLGRRKGRISWLCQECGVSFAQLEALVSHKRNHHHHKEYVCKFCGAQYRELALLQHHVQQVHDTIATMTSEKKYVPPQPLLVSPPEMVKKYFNCDNCSATFFQPDHLQSHLQQAHGLKRAIASSGKQHERLLISTRGHTAGDEEREEEESTDRDDVDDGFDELDYTYVPYGENRTDMRTNSGASEATGTQEQQQQEFPMPCRDCNEMVESANDLLEHAEMHSNAARFESLHECQLCGKKFFNETLIKRHVQERHRAELTETSCAICGKRCKSQTTLIKHAWDHSRDRAHSCSKCGKTFHHQARLKRHMDSHRSKAVRCEICSQEFPDGRTLMNHRHSHSKSNEYPCTECGKTFGSRSSQQIHMRIHTGERPYACRFCWKAFADGGTLRKHERIHTGEKPYACPVCPKAFNQRVVLREHIRAHHSQADTKPNSAEKPNYCCTVCASGTTAPFATPRELVQHLIEHSDTNTAMQRQPPTFPRKYKRRRKLKPHELERLLSGRRKQKAKPQQQLDSEEVEEEEEDDAEENDEESGADRDKYVAYGCSGKANPLPPPARQPQDNILDDNGINMLSNVVLLQEEGGDPMVKQARGNNNYNHRAESPPRKNQPPGRRAKAEQGPSRAGSTQKRAPVAKGRRKTAAPPLVAATAATTSASSSRKRTSSHSRKGGSGMKTRDNITLEELEEQEQEMDDNSVASNHCVISNVMEALFSGRNRKSMLSEIPSHRISSASFPLLDDGNTDDPMLDEPALEENPSSSCARLGSAAAQPARPELDELAKLMEIKRIDKYVEEILRTPVKSKPYQGVCRRGKAKNAPSGSGRQRKTASAPVKANAKETPPPVLRSQRLTRRQLEREVNFLKEAYNGEPNTASNPPAAAAAAAAAAAVARASVPPETNEAPSTSPVGGDVKLEQVERLAAMLLNDGMMDEDEKVEEEEPLRSVKVEHSPLLSDDEEEDTVPDANGLLYGTTNATTSNEMGFTFRCSICAACFDDRTQLILHVPIHI